MKGEPDWMRAMRHKSLDIFYAKPMPTWGGDLSRLDYDDIYYYIKPVEAAGTYLGRGARRHQAHL